MPNYDTGRLIVPVGDAEWSAAEAIAQREMHLRPKGPRGSEQNRRRRNIKARVTKRAWEILYMRRVLGSDFGKAGK